MRISFALTLSAALVSDEPAYSDSIISSVCFSDLDLLTFCALFFSYRQLGAVLASKPLQNLQVTLRGKHYDISDVTTVKDLQSRIKAESGLPSEQQGRLLFGGKRLQPNDVLSDAGVEDGAQLNMVPSTTKTKPKKSAGTTSTASSGSGSDVTGSGSGSGSGGSATTAAAASNPMQDWMKQAGLDGDQLDDIMKNMGGDGEKMPSMEESMEMMAEMMNSPIFQEFMNDPEKLEEARQMILNNPMLKSMMAGIPGMADILNDPEAWRETMQAAANLYQSMDNSALMEAMMSGGMGGGMGMGMGMGGANPGAGLFDGMLDNSAAAAALDELDEDD
jgi:hypothetical protein